MTEPVTTSQALSQHSLTLEECDKLKAALGREPSCAERVLFTVLKRQPSDLPQAPQELKEPESLKAVREFRLDGVADTQDPMANLKVLLSRLAVVSGEGACEAAASPAHANAAVLRIKADPLSGGGAVEKLFALSVCGNGAYVYLAPYEGGKTLAAQAARKLASAGAVPLGAIGHFNRDNSPGAEGSWQLSESMRGLLEACGALHAPLTGADGPTSVVAMAGLIEKPEHITTPWFKDQGDAILLLGPIVDSSDPLFGLGGSVYLQQIHQLKTGTPPRCDLEKECELNLTLRALIASGSIKGARSCDAGGLAVAVAQGCFSQQSAGEPQHSLGATINLSTIAPAGVRLDALLFGESQARVVVSTAALDAVKVLERAKLFGLSAVRLGTVGGEKLTFKTGSGEYSTSLAGLQSA